MITVQATSFSPSEGSVGTEILVHLSPGTIPHERELEGSSCLFVSSNGGSRITGSDVEILDYDRYTQFRVTVPYGVLAHTDYSFSFFLEPADSGQAFQVDSSGGFRVEGTEAITLNTITPSVIVRKNLIYTILTISGTNLVGINTRYQPVMLSNPQVRFRFIAQTNTMIKIKAISVPNDLSTSTSYRLQLRDLDGMMHYPVTRIKLTD